MMGVSVIATKLLSKLHARIYKSLAYRRNVRFGPSCRIDDCVRLEGGNRIGAGSVLINTTVGYGSYLGPAAELINTKIGRYCSIGKRLKLSAGRHPTSGFVSTHPAFFSIACQSGFTFVDVPLFDEYRYVDDKKEMLIEIGSDVWIGDDVTLLDGVKIGHGAIVAAGSVVVKDIDPYEIVGGVPAKVIRKRFSDEQITALLESRWWERSPDWLRKNAFLFADVEAFMMCLGKVGSK